MRYSYGCQVFSPKVGVRLGTFDLSSTSAALSGPGGEFWRDARAHFSEQWLVKERTFDYDRETKSDVSHRVIDATTNSLISQN